MGLLKYTIEKKTGVKLFYPCNFVIYDIHGVVFYTNEYLKNKDNFFNLPEGIYLSSVALKLVKPRIYKLPKLPKIERNLDVKDYKVLFAFNPHKATINYTKRTITFDYSFKQKPEAERVFTALHEMGHKYYGTEKLADLYACRLMLIEGYNPSQISFAQYFVLTNPKSFKRKVFISQKLSNL